MIFEGIDFESICKSLKIKATSLFQWKNNKKIYRVSIWHMTLFLGLYGEHGTINNTILQELLKTTIISLLVPSLAILKSLNIYDLTLDCSSYA